MNHGRLRAISILALPVLLTLSFFIATAALAVGGPINVDELEMRASKRLASSGIQEDLSIPLEIHSGKAAQDSE